MKKIETITIILWLLAIVIFSFSIGLSFGRKYERLIIFERMDSGRSKYDNAAR